MTAKRLLALAAAAMVLGACADSPKPRVDSSIASDPASEVLERVGSPRLVALTADGNEVRVHGVASDGEAELTRTLWYENLAAAAYGQLTSGDVASRTVVDNAGKVLVVEEDPLSVNGSDAFAPTSETENDIAAILAPSANSLGVEVTSIEYVNLFGGTAEVVIEPKDSKGFIAEAGSKIPILLGRLVDDQRPYLVTVVGVGGQPQFIIGYTPGVGGDGQGLGWVAPEFETNAIWGMPVDSDLFDDGGG
jgi:hypothetical protein